MQVQRNQSESQIGFSFFVGIGLVLAGAYFGYITFTEATQIMHDPEVVTKWLDLQKKIFADVSTEKAVTNKMIEGRIVSSHVLVGFALVYVFILARITIAFLKNGVTLVLKSLEFRKNNE